MGAIARLPELAALGVNVIEVMPITAHMDMLVRGSGNWGYDVFSQSHLHHLHGSPDHLREFITAAHDLGLSVILDVVPNHMRLNMLAVQERALLEMSSPGGVDMEADAAPAGSYAARLRSHAKPVRLHTLQEAAPASSLAVGAAPVATKVFARSGEVSLLFACLYYMAH